MTLAQPEVQVQQPKAKTRRKKVPRALVYEMRRGRPIYYRDYEKVLRGELPLEAVMGSSVLQGVLIALVVAFLYRELERRAPGEHFVFANELGFKIAPRTWRILDIAVFDRAALEAEGFTDQYVRTPPLLVIEVDTKADLSRYEGQMEWYIREKVDDLLAAGVKQVVWFTTRDRRVLDARPDQAWVLDRWTRPVPLVVEDLTLHLPTLLEEAGVTLE